MYVGKPRLPGLAAVLIENDVLQRYVLAIEWVLFFCFFQKHCRFYVDGLLKQYNTPGVCCLSGNNDGSNYY